LVFRLNDDVLNQRIRLDRRRFESAHLKYAMLNIQRCYPTLSTLSITVTGEIKETMLSFTPAFYQAFCKEYSSRLLLTYMYNSLCMCAFTLYIENIYLRALCHAYLL